MLNGNTHYKRHLAIGIPNLTSDGNYQSHSFSTPSEPSNYCNSLRQGPHRRQSYQEAHPGPQNSPDSERRREQYLQGNTLDTQLYAGLNSPPQRETHHIHLLQGVNNARQSDGRSRAYSINSLRSNESQESCRYSPQNHLPQHSTRNLHHSHRYNGALHSRSPINYYQNVYQDDIPSVKSSRWSSTGSPQYLLPQFGQSPPSPLEGNNQMAHGPQYHSPIYEDGRRISRRLSYSKFLGIASEEETRAGGEGYEVANEFLRNSMYDWDFPEVRSSMLNLCLEGPEAQPIPPESDEKEERKKPNSTKYITTLESTSRPYTPDKFLTDLDCLKSLQTNKTAKSTTPSSAITKSSIWKLGKLSQGSPKTEEDELNLDLVSMLMDENMPPGPKTEGKRLLKKFRPKKPIPSLDIGESKERGCVSNDTANVSFEGLFGSGGWHEGDGAIETGVEIDVLQPYMATTEPRRSMNLINNGKGETNRNINLELLDNQYNSSSPATLSSPTDRLAAYFRKRFEGLQRVTTLSGSEYKGNLKSKRKSGVTAVKPKEIATTVTAEVVISSHRRIPSSASTPVQHTIQGQSYVERFSEERGISRATEVQTAQTASLVKLKKMLRVGTGEGWLKEEK